MEESTCNLGKRCKTRRTSGSMMFGNKDLYSRNSRDERTTKLRRRVRDLILCTPSSLHIRQRQILYTVTLRKSLKSCSQFCKSRHTRFPGHPKSRQHASQPANSSHPLHPSIPNLKDNQVSWPQISYFSLLQTHIHELVHTTSPRLHLKNYFIVIFFQHLPLKVDTGNLAHHQLHRMRKKLSTMKATSPTKYQN